jgi:protein-S-isoprenylcysteine O-methyltransferase Ste14
MIDKQLFRRLTKLPVMTVFMLVCLMYGIDLTGLGYRIAFANQLAISLMVFMSGLAIIATGGYIFRKANTTLNPTKPEYTSYLVTGGIYRISRNPMYVGFLLWLVACVVYIGNMINLLLLPVFIVLINRWFIVPEEKALASLFGEEFSEYKNKVRRWL